MGIPTGFIIMVVIIYLYFILVHFFTQLFCSRYTVLIPFSFAFSVTAIIAIITNGFERVESISLSLIFFYYAILILLTRKIYRRVNQFLIKHRKLNAVFAGKDFTYVLYHKGIYSRGHSWDETLAGRPSWLDHLLSWMIVLIPLAITLFFFIVLP